MRSVAAASACAVLVGASVSVWAEPVPVGRYVELAVPRRVHPHAAPGGDSQRTGRSAFRVPEQAPSMRWRTERPGRWTSAPALTAEGRLYVPSGRGVTALDAAGRLLWFRALGRVASTPALTSAGRLLSVTDEGELVLLDSAGRRERLALDGPVSGVPLLLDDGTTVVAGRPDGSVSVLGLDGSRLARIETDHGSEPRLAEVRPGLVVSADRSQRLQVFSPYGGFVRELPLAARVSGGPAVGDDETVWVVTDSQLLLGVSPRGRVRTRVELGGRMSSRAPVIGRDGRVLVGLYPNTLLCLSASGAELWRLSADGALGPITVAGGDVALSVSTRGTLYAVGPDGKLRWKVDVRARRAPRPVVGKDGTIYVGSQVGVLSAWR